MDEKRSQHFMKSRAELPNAITSNEDVIQLANHLLACEEISETTLNAIINEKSPAQRMTLLMQCLSARGNNAYDAFRAGLVKIKAPSHVLELLPDFANPENPSTKNDTTVEFETSKLTKPSTSNEGFSGSKQEEADLKNLQANVESQGLPNKYLERAKRLALNNSSSGSPQVYKVPMFITYSDDANKIRRLTTGHNTEQQNTKCLIVLGQKGAGKSQTINNIVNYFYGVKFEDDFRFTIGLNSEKPEATSWITVFEFVRDKNSPIDFNLTLIDTPGFDEVKSGSSNKERIASIQKLMMSDQALPQQIVDGIILVIPNSKTKIRSELQKSFDRTLSSLEGILDKNVLVIETFATAESSPVTESVLKMGIIKKSIIKINNSALYAKPSDDTQHIWNFCQTKLMTFIETVRSLEKCEANPSQLRKEKMTFVNRFLLCGKVVGRLLLGNDYDSLAKGVTSLVDDSLVKAVASGSSK